jgi:hypothetical protein
MRLSHRLLIGRRRRLFLIADAEQRPAKLIQLVDQRRASV